MDHLIKIPFAGMNRGGFKKQIHYTRFTAVQQTK